MKRYIRINYVETTSRPANFNTVCTLMMRNYLRMTGESPLKITCKPNSFKLHVKVDEHRTQYFEKTPGEPLFLLHLSSILNFPALSCPALPHNHLLLLIHLLPSYCLYLA